MSAGKLVLLDLANNSITARGAFHVAEFIKKSKSLLWLNLYMNDIKDEVIEPLRTFTVFFFLCDVKDSSQPCPSHCKS